MIKFGTGGWRAIIGDAFTKANVQKLAQALSMEEHDNGVVIGFDRRFLSDVAAMWLAEVLAGNNIKVHFIEKAVPTPITMFGVKELNTNYGVA
ncbi:MAG: phosphoglucomutase/phosphomannomutase family protein, partial [Erysipelothrix sp.]|nr:phosphoglucomutase/phosphomannomutase family protein [Erysipelothrix sp.]